MLCFVKLPRRCFSFYHCLVSGRQKFVIPARPFTSCCKRTLCDNLIKLNIMSNEPFKMLVSREKTTSRKKAYKKKDDDDEEEEEEESDEDHDFKGDEVKTYETQAVRVDKLLKVCFRSSRKDIEDIFYQTKVRVNGKILKKKSSNANIGDEIDIIHGFVNDNSKLINVNRIEILNIKEDFENLRFIIKVKKSRSLTVQNYSGSDEWRG